MAEHVCTDSEFWRELWLDVMAEKIRMSLGSPERGQDRRARVYIHCGEPVEIEYGAIADRLA